MTVGDEKNHMSDENFWKIVGPNQSLTDATTITGSRSKMKIMQ